MKETTYKCDICSKPCNGGGFGFWLEISNNKTGIWASKDLSYCSGHVCGHEHLLQVVSKVLQELRTSCEEGR